MTGVPPHFGYFAKPPKVSQRTYHTLATHNNYPKCATRTQHTLGSCYKCPKCATTTRHTLGSYCKVPKVCRVVIAHFGYFTVTAQSVFILQPDTLWVVIVSTQSVLGSVCQCVIGSVGQCVIGSLTHFGWFCEVPKVWWNTCITLGNRYTLRSSAELPKVWWNTATL